MASEIFNPLTAAHEIARLLAPSVSDHRADTITLPRREAIAALALIKGVIDILEHEVARSMRH